MTRLKLTDPPALWAAAFAAPVAWAVQLQGVFALSAWATERGDLLALHLLSALCELAAVGGGVTAWRAWRTVGGWPSGTEAPDAARVRYLSVIGVMTSALFVCVMAAQWLAVAMLPHTVGAAG